MNDNLCIQSLTIANSIIRTTLAHVTLSRGDMNRLVDILWIPRYRPHNQYVYLEILEWKLSPRILSVGIGWQYNPYQLLHYHTSRINFNIRC